MKRNIHGNRYHAVAADGAVDWDHPQNKGKVGWWIPGLPGTPAAGSRLLNLCDPNGQSHGTLSTTVKWGGALPPSNFAPLSQTGSTSDNTSVPAATRFDLTATVTLEAWIRPATVSQNGAVIGKWQTGATSSNSFLSYLGQDVLNAKMSLVVEQSNNTTKTLACATVMVAATWVHCIFVADGANLKAYFNGVLDTATQTYDGTIKVTTDPVTIGRLDSTGNNTLYPFNGLIGETSIRSWPLTANQVATQYLLSKSGYRTPDSPLRWMSTRTYSVPATAPVYAGADW